MAAFLEIYAHGFQGVSIDDIVKKTKLTKGAFYHQFPTKLDLGYALVDEVISPMILERWLTPLSKSQNPVEGILIQLNSLIGKASRASLRLGCPLNNLVQEMSPVDAKFKKHLQKALNLWIDGMALQLTRAKKNNVIKPDINVHEAAHFIVMTHEGFYGLLKGLDNSRAFGALYNSLKIYLNSISTNKIALPKES